MLGRSKGSSQGRGLSLPPVPSALSPGTSLPPWSLGQRFVLVQAWKYQKYQKLKLSLFGRPQHKTNQHEPAINLN